MVAIANKPIETPQSSGPRGPKSVRNSVWRGLLKVWHGLVRRDRYEPAKHYMRGPGPASQRRANKAGDDE
jgi:hypothetical protein